MKSNYIYLGLLCTSCFFCNCQNASVVPKDKAKTIETAQNLIKEESSVFVDDVLVESTTLTNACEQLQKDYAVLINKINDNKGDRQLISELIAWTKKPSHLDCLDSDLAYNAQVEKLNETL